MTSSDLTEKNLIVAEGLPLASDCLLISVTFSTALFSPLCTLFSLGASQCRVCVAAHFSCPDTG